MPPPKPSTRNTPTPFVHRIGLRNAYDNGLFKGRDVGKKEGIGLGEIQKRQKNIVKLATVGVPYASIAAAFSLSIEEVRAFLNQKH